MMIIAVSTMLMSICECRSQTLEWIQSKLDWKNRGMNPYKVLGGKRVAFCLLDSTDNSMLVLDRLKQFHSSSKADSVKIVVIWDEIRKEVSDSLQLIEPTLDQYARVGEAKNLATVYGSKKRPYMMLMNSESIFVWDGEMIQSDLVQMLSAFASDGTLPQDAADAYPISTLSIHVDLRKSATEEQFVKKGTAWGGKRRWIRNAPRVAIVTDALRFLTPDVKLVGHFDYHHTAQYDFDLIIDPSADRIKLRDSLIAVFDSVMQTSTVKTTSYDSESEVTIDKFIVRPNSIPETAILYHFETPHWIPTIGATLLTGSGSPWYGGEIGVTVARLHNNDGLVGLAGYRSCIEVLTNGDKLVGGFSTGLDISAFSTFRLRLGVYSDFEKNTTMMFLPEIGITYKGWWCLTVGGHLPILGSNALPASFRFGLTFNLLPDGAQ